MVSCPRCAMAYDGGTHLCDPDAQDPTQKIPSDEPTAPLELLNADTWTPPIPRVQSQLPTGTELGGYRVLGLLGEGAIGRVYRAEHLKLGRKVALKILRPEYAAHATVVRRFFGEARAVNQIAHEHIVSVTDFFEGGEGPAFYIMELLEGQTLRDLLRKERVLPADRVVAIARQVTAALAAVHAHGIVHRDLKPENIFLVQRPDGSDFVKLLDFGIAKLSDPLVDLSSAETGMLVGTPQYMAPEQTYGSSVDHRADVYALGVVLYEMLTGATPFKAATIQETLQMHRSAAPSRFGALPAAPTISEALERVVQQCLDKDPAARPSSAQALKDALEAALAPPSPSKVRWAPLVLAAAMVLGLVAFGLARWLEPAPPTSISVASAPTQIRVQVDSVPAGAQIRLEGDPRLLGTTPATLDFSRAEAEQVLLLELSGFLPVQHRFVPRQDVALTVHLESATEKVATPSATTKTVPIPKDPPLLAPPKAAPKTKTKERIGVSEVLDPFGD